MSWLSLYLKTNKQKNPKQPKSYKGLEDRTASLKQSYNLSQQPSLIWEKC